MILQKSQILSAYDIKIKVRRMAFEILERNYHAKEIVLAGIVREGLLLAQMIHAELSQIAQMPISVLEIKLVKTSTSQPEIHLNIEPSTLEDKCVIFVDEVLNTGRTIAFALNPFLSVSIQKLQIAVLVDRNHRTYPVSADYVGYALSTTLSDHVEAILDSGDKFGVYLL